MRAAKKLPYPRELLKELVAPLSKDFWIIKKRFWLVWLVWATKFTIAGLVMAIVAGIGFWAFAYYYTDDLKDDKGHPLDFEKLAHSDFKKSSLVYASDGKTIIGTFFDEVRDPIKANEIPLVVKNAFIAAEDRRFYSHHGIDPQAIVRASFFNICHIFAPQYFQKSGASTIQAQLARRLHDVEVEEFRSRSQNLWRKIKEARVAIQLNKRYSKDKVLGSFLSLIYFGHGVNGVPEATRRYFGKDIRKDIRKDGASLRVAAILASLNKSPSLYCPIYHKPTTPDIKKEYSAQETKKLLDKYETDLARENVRITRARDRYNWVLFRMLQENFITQGQCDEAKFTKDDPLQPEIVRFTPLKDRQFGYGTRLVKEMLMFNGYKDEDITSYGGFRIVTPFDINIGKIATEEFNRHLGLINLEIPAGEEKLKGAFVIIENKTSKILALSGGPNFDEDQYNRVLASRSPGSAAKPLTYAAAFEYFGKTFADTICNCPFRMRGANGKAWVPKNYKEDNPVSYGYIPLPIGLIRSVNLATLNLARSVGVDAIINVAHKLGIWGNTRTIRDSDGNVWFKEPGQELTGGLVPLLPTAIGASDMNLLELTNAYAVFARGGIYMKPTLIMELKDFEGKTIYKTAPAQEKRVLTKETTDRIVILMRAVTKVGTAKISMRNIEQQVAVKTGTSNGPRDVSMIGFTPELTMGIRLGYDSNKIIELPQYLIKVSKSTKMQASGGWVVGPLFRKIIDKIYEQRQKVGFAPEIEQRTQELLATYPDRYK